MISMGRRSRVHYPGAVYHAMARGVDGRNIFSDDQDRNSFLSALERIKRQTDAVVYAYCLMGNHFHLAIKVGPVPLAAVMQRILTSYSITFNNRHDRSGHLFQARYKSIVCLDDAYLIGLIRYIHLNPVRAGLVAKPDDWPWSSHRTYLKSDQDGLLTEDLPNLDTPIEPVAFDPWPKDCDKNPPSLTRSSINETLTLTAIASLISEKTGIGIDELRSGSRRPNVVRAKRALSREAVRQGQRLSAIACWLGSTENTVAYYLRLESN